MRPDEVVPEGGNSDGETSSLIPRGGVLDFERFVVVDANGERTVPGLRKFKRVGALCAVLAAACGTALLTKLHTKGAPFQRTVGDSMLEFFSRGGSGYSGSAGSGYSGSGSGGLHSMKPEVLRHLWKVERQLVDDMLCPAVTREAAALRDLAWPRHDAGLAPRLGKVLYINLDWDKDRKVYMEEQLASLSEKAWATHKYCLAWERMSAIRASDFKSDAAYASWRDKGFSQAKSPDVRGDWRTAACAFSHYTAISQIPEAPGSDLVIIAEDDVEFNPKFLKVWEELWPYIPPAWDVIRVGWFSDHQNCSQTVNSRVDRAGWQDPRNGECAYCGAQAYIVNPASKERVLKRFEFSRITHADELLGAPTPQLEDPAAVPDLKVFVTWPMLSKIHFKEGLPAFASDRVEGREAVLKMEK